MPCVVPSPPRLPSRARPADSGFPVPSPTPAFTHCPHQRLLALQAAGRFELCSWGLASPSGRPWEPWGVSWPLCVSRVLQAAHRCLPVAQPPVHLPSSGHTPDRASLKIASHRPASMEPPSDPEITALAARGGEPLCDYVLRGRSKKALA